MEENKSNSQEKFYSFLTKTLSDWIHLIKYLVYPITIIFIIIFFIWGIDIIQLNSELNNIKTNLDLKIKEIDIKQRETNVIAEEKLKLLNAQLKYIDSSFTELETSYNDALKESNEELSKLKANSKNLSDFSSTIKYSISSALEEYKKAQNKYSAEIEYASKGADQRKKDIEEIFQQSKKLLLSVAEIIENTNLYIEESTKATLVLESYDAEKVKSLNKKLKTQLETLRKTLTSK